MANLSCEYDDEKLESSEQLQITMIKIMKSVDRKLSEMNAQLSQLNNNIDWMPCKIGVIIMICLAVFAWFVWFNWEKFARKLALFFNEEGLRRAADDPPPYEDSNARPVT